MSALHAYRDGKKELFQGFAVENLEHDQPDAWEKHPVFHFDFDGENDQNSDTLEQALQKHLKRWYEIYTLPDDPSATLGERFQNLLIKAHMNTGHRCVALVDELWKAVA